MEYRILSHKLTDWEVIMILPRTKNSMECVFLISGVRTRGLPEQVADSWGQETVVKPAGMD